MPGEFYIKMESKSDAKLQNRRVQKWMSIKLGAWTKKTRKTMLVKKVW
jgi:hypothetical protein